VSGEAVEVARKRGDPFTLAFVLCAAARLRLQARDDASARALQREAQSVADAKGFAFYQNLDRLHAGLLLSRGGRAEEGAEIIRACMEAHGRNGTRWQLPILSAFLTEALAAAGMREEAAWAVDDGLRLSEADEDRDFAAELLRLRGCLRERAGDRTAAEVDLEAALALARQQGAKLWELRAAASLARLWRDQGRLAEARGLLAPVYAAFTEGFAFPDLVEARALLEELGAAPVDGAGRRQDEVRKPQGPDRLREPVPGR
jgi:hypothetical protein